MRHARAFVIIATSALLIAGRPSFAAPVKAAPETAAAAAEVTALSEDAALSGIIYQPSRLAAKTPPPPPSLSERDVRLLAATDSPIGEQASQLLAEANGAALTPGARVDFSDQPPMVIGDMTGLARKSCERAGGAFEAGGTGVFICR